MGRGIILGQYSGSIVRAEEKDCVHGEEGQVGGHCVVCVCVVAAALTLQQSAGVLSKEARNLRIPAMGVLGLQYSIVLGSIPNSAGIMV